jgi:hypothetical protein
MVLDCILLLKVQMAKLCDDDLFICRRGIYGSCDEALSILLVDLPSTSKIQRVVAEIKKCDVVFKAASEQARARKFSAIFQGARQCLQAIAIVRRKELIVRMIVFEVVLQH